MPADTVRPPHHKVSKYMPRPQICHGTALPQAQLPHRLPPQQTTSYFREPLSSPAFPGPSHEQTRDVRERVASRISLGYAADLYQRSQRASPLVSSAINPSTVIGIGS